MLRITAAAPFCAARAMAPLVDAVWMLALGVGKLEMNAIFPLTSREAKSSSLPAPTHTMSRSTPEGGVAGDRPLGNAVFSAIVWPPPLAANAQSSANHCGGRSNVHVHILEARLTKAFRDVRFDLGIRLRA